MNYMSIIMINQAFGQVVKELRAEKKLRQGGIVF